MRKLVYNNVYSVVQIESLIELGTEIYISGLSLSKSGVWTRVTLHISNFQIPPDAIFRYVKTAGSDNYFDFIGKEKDFSEMLTGGQIC